MVNSWPLWIIDAKTTQRGILRLPVISRNREHEIWLLRKKRKRNRLEQFVPDDRAAEGDRGERGAQCLFLYLCTEWFKNNILLCCSYVTTTQQKSGTVLYSCSPFILFWIPEFSVPSSWVAFKPLAERFHPLSTCGVKRPLSLCVRDEMTPARAGFLACVIILASACYFSYFAPHGLPEGWNVSLINGIYLTCLSHVQMPVVNI